MTPAITIFERKKISFQVHEYTHDVSNPSYGMEAAEKLAVNQDRVFKTLVVTLDTGEFVVAILPVPAKLNLKKLAKMASAKKAMMAQTSEVERSTGYVIGGVSPIGQKKKLRSFIDVTATAHGSVYVSAGRRGLEIELSPNDLAMMIDGSFTQLAC